mgnify:CR=1 FL=1
MSPDTRIHLPPIAGYHPTTLIDWPGRLAAIVFLPGCNFRCPFCHAGPLLGEPAEIVPIDRVLAHLADRDDWLDGVVVCGGEPTLQPALADLCRCFRETGLAVKLDTNGTRPAVVETLLSDGLVDAVAMDFKAPLDARYAEACGVETVDLEAVRRSVALLRAGDVEYEFRTTVVPTLHGEEEIRAMGAAIAGADAWTLQPFEPEGALAPSYRTIRPYPPAEMAALADLGRTFVARCRVRGQG